MTNELSSKINEYLHNWYTCLPMPALNEIHQLTPNHLYQLSDDIFEEELDKLRDEWYELDLIDKLEIHDRIFDDYAEFTKNIKIEI